MKKTGARILALAITSGVTAEFLLGDQYLQGTAPVGQQIAMLVMFTPFYGAAAVIIREVARRTGRGVADDPIAALAYGIFEEGVVDQSLFNPNFAGIRLLDFGHLPVIDTAGPRLVCVLALHMIWSISAPIAIVETLFPEPPRGKMPVGQQRQAPWLGRLGLGVAIACFIVGATTVFFISTMFGGFMATPLQLVVSVLATAGCVVLALRLPRSEAVEPRSPWLGLLLGFVATSLFQLIDQISDSWSPWLAVAALLAVLVVSFWLVHRLRLDAFGLAAGDPHLRLAGLGEDAAPRRGGDDRAERAGPDRSGSPAAGPAASRDHSWIDPSLRARHTDKSCTLLTGRRNLSQSTFSAASSQASSSSSLELVSWSSSVCSSASLP